MILTLRTRMAVISILVFGLLLGGMSVVSYRVLASRVDADVTARLSHLTDGLHGYLQVDGDVPSLDFDPNDGEQAAFIHEATRYYQLYDTATGRLLVQSDGFAPLSFLLTPAEVQAFGDDPKLLDLETDYGRIRISNTVIPGSGGRKFLLQVGVSLAPTDTVMRRYRDLLLWRVPAAFLIAALAVWWFSGIALAPLGHMAEAARALDVRALQDRLPTRGVHDELDVLAQAFNDTLQRLEQAVGEMRQFSAALAHELRTPLTALRGEIELALRTSGIDEVQKTAFVSQIEEIDRLKRLIDQILTLARAESGQIPLTFAPVDLGGLAASLVDQLEPVAHARNIGLRYEGTAATVVNGDEGWLRRLLLNLIDNALKFTRPGGHVIVRVGHEAAQARIEVTDTGIGMSPGVTQQAFERFFRADPARSPATEGAGLGLSLVKWIVDRHHGTIRVASQPDEGSTFSVTLPAGSV
jgi:heavy metal sensor kinase